MKLKRWQRIFIVIWAGQFLSFLTSAIVGYALIFWLSIETRSAEVLAMAVVAGFLPQIVLGPIAGVYIDRWDRKRTMIFSDVFIALCTLLLAWLFWVGRIEAWHIYLLLACRSIGSAFHTPSMQASIPLLAPEDQLTRIAGINQTIQSVCNIAAPGIGAALIGFWKMTPILLLDVLGAVVACVSLLFVLVPRPRRREAAKPHLWREVKEGVGAMFRVRGVAWLSLFSLVFHFILMPLAALFPLLTIEHYQKGVIEMGWIESLWSIGSLVGGAVMGWRVWRVNKARLINICYIVSGLYLLVSGAFAPSMFPIFLWLTIAGGAIASVSQAAFMGILQSHIPSGLLGRAMSMYFSAVMLPAMVGLLATGWLVERLGLTPPFVVGGALIVLLGFASLLPRSVQAAGRIKG